MLLCHSRLPESSFLPRGIENGQLLQYSHAYQLSVCANVKTMDAHACVLPRTAEQCDNENKGGEQVAKVGGLRPLIVYCDNS